MARKVYVDVLIKQDREGRITPLSITWEDGRVYEIDKITRVCNAASLKAGGAGIRYTCVIRNKETFLFLEDNKWFVESKT
ncbi:MAG: hypothetical protein ACOYJX_05910 [Acutalibacteraceae bacterium]|jgi:hypothetical protein